MVDMHENSIDPTGDSEAGLCTITTEPLTVDTTYLTRSSDFNYHLISIEGVHGCIKANLKHPLTRSSEYSCLRINALSPVILDAVVEKIPYRDENDQVIETLKLRDQSAIKPILGNLAGIEWVSNTDLKSQLQPKDLQQQPRRNQNNNNNNRNDWIDYYFNVSTSLDLFDEQLFPDIIWLYDQVMNMYEMDFDNPDSFAKKLKTVMGMPNEGSLYSLPLYFLGRGLKLSLFGFVQTFMATCEAFIIFIRICMAPIQQVALVLDYLFKKIFSNNHNANQFFDESHKLWTQVAKQMVLVVALPLAPLAILSAFTLGSLIQITGLANYKMTMMIDRLINHLSPTRHANTPMPAAVTPPTAAQPPVNVTQLAPAEPDNSPIEENASPAEVIASTQNTGIELYGKTLTRSTFKGILNDYYQERRRYGGLFCKQSDVSKALVVKIEAYLNEGMNDQEPNGFRNSVINFLRDNTNRRLSVCIFRSLDRLEQVSFSDLQPSGQTTPRAS